MHDPNKELFNELMITQLSTLSNHCATIGHGEPRVLLRPVYDAGFEGWKQWRTCVVRKIHHKLTRPMCDRGFISQQQKERRRGERKQGRDTFLTCLRLHQVLDSSREPLLPGVLPSVPDFCPLHLSYHFTVLLTVLPYFFLLPASFLFKYPLSVRLTF